MALVLTATDKTQFGNTPKSMVVGKGGSGVKVYGAFERKDATHTSYQVWPPMREVQLDNPKTVNTNPGANTNYVRINICNDTAPCIYNSEFILNGTNLYLVQANVQFEIEIRWSSSLGDTITLPVDVDFTVAFGTSTNYNLQGQENYDNIYIGSHTIYLVGVIPSGTSFTGTYNSGSACYVAHYFLPGVKSTSTGGNGTIHGEYSVQNPSRPGTLIDTYISGTSQNYRGGFIDYVGISFMVYQSGIMNCVPMYPSSLYDAYNITCAIFGQQSFYGYIEANSSRPNDGPIIYNNVWNIDSGSNVPAQAVSNFYIRANASCSDEQFKFYDNSYHINKQFKESSPGTTESYIGNLSAFFCYSYTGYSFTTYNNVTHSYGQPTGYVSRYLPASGQTAYLTYHSTYDNILYLGEIPSSQRYSLSFYEDNLYHISYISTIQAGTEFNAVNGISKYTPVIKFDNVSYEYYETNNIFNTDSRNVINYRYKLSNKFSQMVEWAVYDYTLNPASGSTNELARFNSNYRIRINANSYPYWNGNNVITNRQPTNYNHLGTTFTVFVSPFQTMVVGFRTKTATGTWGSGTFNHTTSQISVNSSTQTFNFLDYDYGSGRTGRNWSWETGYGNVPYSLDLITTLKGSGRCTVTDNTSGGTIGFTFNSSGLTSLSYWDNPWIEVRIINNSSSGAANQNFAWAINNDTNNTTASANSYPISTALTSGNQTFYVYGFYNSYPDRSIRFHVFYLGSITYNTSVHAWKYRFAQGPPIGGGGVGQDDVFEIMAPPTVTAASFQAALRRNNAIISNGVTWAISSGGSYASINSSGLVTIKTAANNSNITISATYGGNTYTKTVKVTYLAGATGTTVITYGPDGTATVTTTITNGDGSSSSSSITYDENGNPISGTNTNTDPNGNVNTQEVEYDDEGNPYNVGYTIDTSGNNNGGESTGTGVDSGVLAFDGRDFVATLKAKITFANLTTGVCSVINISDDSTGSVNGAALIMTKHTGGYYIAQNGTAYRASSSAPRGLFRCNEYINSAIGTGKEFVHVSKKGSAATGSSASTATRFGMRSAETTATFIFIFRYTSNILSAEIQKADGSPVAYPASDTTWDFTGNELRNVTVEIGKWTNYSGGAVTFNIEVIEFDVHKTT